MAVAKESPTITNATLAATPSALTTSFVLENARALTTITNATPAATSTAATTSFVQENVRALTTTTSATPAATSTAATTSFVQENVLALTTITNATPAATSTAAKMNTEVAVVQGCMTDIRVRLHRLNQLPPLHSVCLLLCACVHVRVQV